MAGTGSAATTTPKLAATDDLPRQRRGVPIFNGEMRGVAPVPERLNEAIGPGEGENGCTLHSSNYDFNDDVLPIGAAYWATLVENELPKA